jgi:hypothetical protein
MADGSVRFLTYSVDSAPGNTGSSAFTFLCSRNGGEVIPNY